MSIIEEIFDNAAENCSKMKMRKIESGLYEISVGDAKQEMSISIFPKENNMYRINVSKFDPSALCAFERDDDFVILQGKFIKGLMNQKFDMDKKQPWDGNAVPYHVYYKEDDTSHFGWLEGDDLNSFPFVVLRKT